mmetsp:Transcript_1116/g.3109  ORF Transcript_1116/g.3109 Transcript_1116/m.3109 type:complete len:154 (-) Transcript_1116:154-615(-)
MKIRTDATNQFNASAARYLSSYDNLAFLESLPETSKWNEQVSETLHRSVSDRLAIHAELEAIDNIRKTAADAERRKQLYWNGAPKTGKKRARRTSRGMRSDAAAVYSGVTLIAFSTIVGAFFGKLDAMTFFQTEMLCWISMYVIMIAGTDKRV